MRNDRRPYDPRAVANLLLDLAQEDGVAVSNLVLQKLLYFAHARFLIRTDEPLVQGGFEAWTYGPVHPAVYSAFKAEGNRPITMRAMGRNVMTGELRALPLPADHEASWHIQDVLRAYGRLSAAQLIDISLAPKGPWAAIVNQARVSVALGMRIPDSMIRERFKYHKVAVGLKARSGHPNEDMPLCGDPTESLGSRLFSRLEVSDD